MSFELSRRRFVISIGSLAAASVLPERLAGALEAPLSPAASEINFGYAAITWGGNDVQAIKDVGEVGFRGIQLRSPILKDFGDKPKALAEILKQHKLQFVALSGGGPGGVNFNEADQLATQVKHATFLRDAGGLYLQMTDSARPKDRKPESKDFKALGPSSNWMGFRTKRELRRSRPSSARSTWRRNSE